jgi:hypothetical protein
MALVLEIKGPEGWREVGRQVPGENKGSLSNNTDSGRDILHFECFHTMAVIERSLGGADQELAGSRMRVTATVGMERVAVLSAGESYELELCTDRMTSAAPFRFRYEEEAR